MKEYEDFVFLDAVGKPFAVRLIDGEYWLCYWNKGMEQFVTLRQTGTNEMKRWYNKKLPKKQAALYGM